MSRDTAQTSLPLEPGGAAPDTSAVRSLMAAGLFKRAVEAAKDLHRRQPTPASEALLAEAYAQRILAFEPQMTVEADALFRLARERCPGAREKLDALRPRLDVRFGRVDAAARPLAEDAAAAADRAAAEEALRRELVDPGVLARSPALPEGHALRRAAAAVDAAFRAVTSGPVAEADLELPEVSRRGPLAAWKPLVRAIAAFYRGDTSACERNLALVDAEVAPVRLVPAIRALARGEPSRRPGDLVERVSGKGGALRPALEKLDAVLSPSRTGEAVRAIREAVQECRHARPDLVEPLRQRILVRCLLAGIPAERVVGALGGPPSRDAALCRLVARAGETAADPVLAAAGWEAFRRSSVAQGDFEENGPESAAVWSRILDLLEGAPEAFAEGRARGRPSPLGGLLDGSVPEPADVFWRLAKADPRPEVFERWLAWGRRVGGKNQTAAACDAWRRARPEDPRPLLVLVEQAEKRGALKKALGLLERAEALERLDPAVARARFRLGAALALKHLRERQASLAAKDVAALEGHAAARLGRPPALVAGLRALVARASGDEAGAAEARRSAAGALGGEREAAFLLQALGSVADPFLESREPLPEGSPDELVRALAAACLLCEEASIAVRLPRPWEAKLRKGLDGAGAPDDAALAALARVALRSRLERLAYAAAGAGLRRGGDNGRFLLLRALALGPMASRRRAECLDAATEAARRQGDASLAALIRDAAPWHSPRTGSDRLSADDFEAVLARERREKSRDADAVVRAAPACQCPACRGLAPDEEEDDDEFEELFGDESDGELPFSPGDVAGLPPRLRGVVLELLSKFGELPDPDELLRRDPGLYRRLMAVVEETVAGGGPFEGWGRRRGRRKGRR
jgi:hypothetical protein